VPCYLAQDRIHKANLLFAYESFGILDGFIDNGVLTGGG